MRRLGFVALVWASGLLVAGCDIDPDVESCDVLGETCAPAECRGNTRVTFTCADNGEGFICSGEFVDCPGDCEEGACLPPPDLCPTPGELCAEPVCIGPDILVGRCDGDFVCRAERIECAPEFPCVDGRCSAPEQQCGEPGTACGDPTCPPGGGAVIERVCNLADRCVERRTDCAVGEVCFDGACVDNAPGECAVPGEDCGPRACEGAGIAGFFCTDDLECIGFVDVCPDGTTCDNGVCRELAVGECVRAGVDCGPRFCRGNDVIRPACDGNLQCQNTILSCQGGEVCLQGRCVFEPECELPGAPCAEPVCAGNGIIEFVCSDDFECEEIADVCPDGGVCEAGVCRELEPGECIEVGVDCGERFCRGDDVIRPACDGNLQCQNTILSCQGEEVCRDGRCVPDPECAVAGQVCGEPVCDGIRVAEFICDAELDCVESRRDCPGDDQCRDGACRVVDDGPCDEPGAPCGAPICEGNGFTEFVCGDDFVCQAISDACPEDQLCEAGVCRPLQPGECLRGGVDCGPRFCQGNDVIRPACDVNLVCQNTVLSCEGAEICEGGECVFVPQCEIPGDLCGAPECDGNTAVERPCGEDLLCGETRTPCGADVCENGGCRPAEPGECAQAGAPCGEPVCQGADVVRPVCDADLVCQNTIVSCQGEEVCVDGRCALPPQCDEPGTFCEDRRCEGNAIVGALCDANRQCIAERVECGENQVCSEAQCIPAGPEACDNPGEPCGDPFCRGTLVVDNICGEDGQCNREPAPCERGDQTCSFGFCVQLPQCDVPGALCAPSVCEGQVAVRQVCSQLNQCLAEREQCVQGEICDGGACRPIEPGECARAGDACREPVCQGSDAVRFVCDANLLCQPNILSCQGGELCEDGVCVLQPQCDVPGEECEPAACDGNTVVRRICGDDLQCAEERSVCRAGELCDNAICRLPQPGECAVAGASCGEPVCRGDSVARPTCNDDLECEEVLSPCPPGQTCDGARCVLDAECDTPGEECEPAACDGNTVVRQVCGGNLQCIEQRSNCPAGELCDAGVCRQPRDGECAVAGAACGVALCLGNNVIAPTCNAQLQCVDAVVECLDGQICLRGACVPEPQCDVPGEQCEAPVCDGDTVVRQVCDADRQCVEQRSACQADEVCIDARCVTPPACEVPGEACGEAVCDGSVLIRRVCSADLECVDQPAPCPFGQLCDAGVCRDPGPGECVITDAPCGDPVCQGDVVVQPTCDAEGECQNRIVECGDGQACVDGACQDQGGGGECACSTPGATVGPALDGCFFEDNDQCSGWQSVVVGADGGDFSDEALEEALNRVLPDGTIVCAFGCCMQLTCP